MKRFWFREEDDIGASVLLIFFNIPEELALGGSFKLPPTVENLDFNFTIACQGKRKALQSNSDSSVGECSARAHTWDRAVLSGMCRARSVGLAASLGLDFPPSACRGDWPVWSFAGLPAGHWPVVRSLPAATLSHLHSPLLAVDGLS